MAEKRAHVIVSGRVQGVFYRSETEKAASAKGLKGWVKNRSDGTVEAVFEGDEEAVASMIEWCKKGSPRAKVDKVDVDWEEPKGESSFEVRY